MKYNILNMIVTDLWGFLTHWVPIIFKILTSQLINENCKVFKSCEPWPDESVVDALSLPILDWEFEVNINSEMLTELEAW